MEGAEALRLGQGSGRLWPAEEIERGLAQLLRRPGGHIAFSTAPPSAYPPRRRVRSRGHAVHPQVFALPIASRTPPTRSASAQAVSSRTAARRRCPFSISAKYEPDTPIRSPRARNPDRAVEEGRPRDRSVPLLLALDDIFGNRASEAQRPPRREAGAAGAPLSPRRPRGGGAASRGSPRRPIGGLAGTSGRRGGSSRHRRARRSARSSRAG